MASGHADVIEFPLNNRNCGNCEFGALGSFGVWCDEYRMPIWDEKQEARECETFQMQGARSSD